MIEQIKKYLNEREIKVISKLNTPSKIQDFLEKLPFNFENQGETYYSPRKVLKQREAHCFEGALLAITALKYHGVESYLLDLKAKRPDSDHVVAVFKINGYLGAISKTNHAVLRYRDPIYKTNRELALSFFHEYFLNTGQKTLISFSKPFDPFKIFDCSWVAQQNDLDTIAEAIDKSAHIDFVPKENKRYIRRASQIEIEAGKIEQYNNKSHE